MDFTWVLLLLCFHKCSGVTLEEIADSLQTVQSLLLNDNECKIDCGKINDIKSQLREYIVDKINEYFDTKRDNLVTKDGLLFELERYFDGQGSKIAGTERVLHAFASEKRVRKEIENKLLVAQSSLLENGVKIDNIKDEIFSLEKEKESLKKTNDDLKKEVQTLKSKIVDREEILDLILEVKGACHTIVEKVNTSVKSELNIFKTELDETVAHRNEHQIVFSAQIKYGQSYKDIKPWQTIVFGQVGLNVGQAYSGDTGEFTSPVDGIYVFHVHITGGDNHGLEIRMSKNRNTILLLYVKGPGHGTDGGDVAIQLKKGDIVRVEKYGPWGQRPFYIHHAFSFFTGFLLHKI